ncbi:phage tail tape measure protein [Arcobacter sp. L]|uniref:phage tail tape measure protein n=1 Tax=Arcobacter sp. L TaxID=944547 RepID=UPI0002296503|nr:phage tail tape measure protein [Arcobacter sp. L]BAK73760.1 phage tail tape measure protein [Arcobacter sp. L]
MKTVGLGIVIGAAFKGASAFSSAINSTSLLDNKLKKLESQKFQLANKFGATSTEVTKLNTKIIALKNNMTLLEKTKLSFNGIEEYRNKFKSSVMDKVALGGTVAMPFKFAIDFESAMADVKKVVNFATDEEAKRFEQEIIKLSTKKEIPLNANELASIAASGGQLGIAKENLLEFTTTVAKMSTAFDMSAESAGDSIAKLMNVYGLTQNQVVELGDAINHLSDTSASKAREVVEVLGRIGGTAKVFGLTTVQTSALSSAFLALGKPPEVAATSINALLLKLKTADKQNKSFQEGLDAIGLSAKDVKKSIEKDAQGGLISFLKTLEKLPKSKQMGVLSDLFGAEYSDDIALLVGGLDNYTKALENTADRTKYLGSMQREFETRSKTTKNNLVLLGNSVKSIAINFGSLLLPALNSVITPVREIGNKVGDFVTKFPVLSQVIGMVVVGAVALSIGFSAVGYMASFVIAGFLNIGKALLVLNSLFLANPIGLAVVGIVVAATLIYTYWTPIKGFFIGLWDGIKSAFSTGITFVKEYLGWTPLGMIINNWTPITNFFLNLWNGITSIFNSIVSVIAPVFETLALKVKEPFVAVFDWFFEKFQWLETKVLGAINSTKEFFSGAGDKVGSFFKDASSFFTLEGGYKKEIPNLQPVEPVKLDNLNGTNISKNQNVTIQKIEINNPSSTADVEKGVAAGLKTNTTSLSDKEF